MQRTKISLIPLIPSGSLGQSMLNGGEHADISAFAPDAGEIHKYFVRNLHGLAHVAGSHSSTLTS